MMQTGRSIQLFRKELKSSKYMIHMIPKADLVFIYTENDEIKGDYSLIVS